jgi:hypothetical protein
MGLAIGGTAGSAAADVTSQSMSASGTPAAQSISANGGVNLDLSWSTGYDSTFEPALNRAVLHLDNDFGFDTTGFAQCQLASIQFKFHAQAVAACPGGVVGSGTASINNSAIKGIVDVFNGPPPGGYPFVYLNFDIGPGATSFTVPGTFSPSARGGDFGTQIDIGTFPDSPGLGFTQVSLKFPNQERVPGHPFVSARCESDHLWEFSGEFTYYGGAMTGASATTPCGSFPTGERAKALRKCKKIKRKTKKQKRARHRCSKRAKKLPV